MPQKALTWSLFSMLLLWGLLLPRTSMAEIVDRIAGVVEGEAVTLSDIRWLLRYKGMTVPEDPAAQRNLYFTVLNRIIDQKLIANQAQQTPGIRITPEEVETQLEAYRSRFGSPEEFQERLQAMEITRADLHDLIRRELAVWKFVQLRFEPFIIVLPQQIQTYYEEEFVPRLKETGSPIPPLDLVQEQIREILILERTNEAMDRWVTNARRRARVQILLDRPQPLTPNLPPALREKIELQPLPAP